MKLFSSGQVLSMFVRTGFPAVFAIFATTLTFSATAPQAAASNVECDSVQSKILGQSVGYCVDLPADYASAPSKRYPVLYFLHGLFEDEHSWVDRGGKDIFDQMESQGKIGKFIVVMPEGGKSFYVNACNGGERYEDFFIQELLPFIDHKYRTLGTRAGRAISGLSMGGYGALHLAMSHPDLFVAVSADSPALLPKFPNPLPTEGRWGFYAKLLQGPFCSPLSESYWDKNNPLALAEHPQTFAGLKIYFDCGDHDRYGFEEGAGLLDKELTAQGYPHEYTLRPGNHGWSFMQQYMHFSLEFDWQAFQPGLAAAAGAGSKGGSR
jgi:putative tributyrin esterase